MSLDIKKIIESKKTMRVLYSLGAIVLALFIFHAGVLVGFRKATFSYRFGDTYYHKAFGDRKESFRMGMRRNEFSIGHGAAGKVVSLELPKITILGRDGVEKTVVIDNRTEIRQFRETATTTDIKIDDYAVVLGSPNEQGEIQAKLIRLLPAPETTTSSSTQSTR